MKYFISALLFIFLFSAQAQNWGPYPGPPPWFWHNAWRPTWYYAGMYFPRFNWVNYTPYGFWQCTAFNGYMQPFSFISWDMNQAGYGALYSCGGPYYINMGCFIPPGYCRLQQW